MNFTDIFKGKSLIALISAIVICVGLKVIGTPSVIIYIVMYALGCNYSNFADWIQENILNRFQ